MTPTDAASKPICVWNSFSTATHSMKPCNPTPTCKGSRRRPKLRGARCVLWVTSVAVIGGLPG